MYIWFIAERSEANNRVLWAQQSQLAFICIIRTSIKFTRLSPGGKARVQNGVSGSFLGAVFKVRGLDKFVMKFYQGRLATAPRFVEFV